MWVLTIQAIYFSYNPANVDGQAAWHFSWDCATSSWCMKIWDEAIFWNTMTQSTKPGKRPKWSRLAALKTEHSRGIIEIPNQNAPRQIQRCSFAGFLMAFTRWHNVIGLGRHITSKLSDVTWQHADQGSLQERQQDQQRLRVSQISKRPIRPFGSSSQHDETRP